MRKFPITLLVLTVVTLPFTALAHAGRTDSSGCHTNKKTGDYHCHSASQTKTKEARTIARTTAKRSTKTTSKAGDYNCVDFASQSEAQDFFIKNGGPTRDQHHLDADKDGKACDDLS